MLGLRAQYALSTFFVAQMRQNLHFTYLQDDIRVNDKLTVNAGLRYEYATPMWEATNTLTNFDPTTVTMVKATDGSVADRALVNPDRNNFGPRLGFAYTPMSKTVVRGGWGVSYVHINRIGSANLLGINGPQVVRAAVVQSDPTAASFRPTEQGYPAGLTDVSQFNPLTALVSYIPRDFQSSPVQSWYASVQREFGPSMMLDVAYVGNKATDLLLSSATTIRPRPTTPRERFRWRPPADSDLRRHHLQLQRREIALRRAPGEVRVAPRIGDSRSSAR